MVHKTTTNEQNNYKDYFGDNSLFPFHFELDSFVKLTSMQAPGYSQNSLKQ